MICEKNDERSAEAEEQTEASEELRKEVFKKSLAEKIKVLSPNYRRVLALRRGLDGESEHTLEETARIMGMSCGKIADIEHIAMRRLFRTGCPRRTNRLKGYN